MTTRRGALTLACGALALWAAPRPLLAQQGCAAPAPTPAAQWPAPLDRAVSLEARDLPLRDALARLSTAAGVPFAFSPDLVALDRRVCVAARRLPLGQVLDALLGGSGTAASVVAGRVVLVPRVAQAPTPPPTRNAPDVLERVVVTGNSVATARRALPIGVEVIEGAKLRRQSVTSVADMLNASVPGAWVWQSSPTTLLAQYAGIRGASSFASSAPKVYLDGVEVANPLLLTQLDPSAVDHVEVIRGPQGSALYGSDAISGVVNVVSRHDGGVPGGARLLVASMAGAGTSSYGAALVPTHDQRAALRVGGPLRSAGLAAQFGQSGAVFPSADSRTTSLVGDARLVGSDAVFTLTGRLFDHQAGQGRNPLLAGLASVPGPDSGMTRATLGPQSAREYTVGGTVTLQGGDVWTHTAVLGIDGYRLRHVVTASALDPMDSTMGAADGAGDRTTLRLSSVAHFGGVGSAPATTVTLGLDQAVLRVASPVTVSGASGPVVEDVSHWNNDAGLFGQVATAWNDALFLSAGLRVELNDAFTGRDRNPLMPMLGVATVRDVGPAAVKLRAAYGRGIRPPGTPARGSYIEQVGGVRALPSLDPEVQSGTELGVEVYFGQAASLQLTRFDQLASGLVQNVLLGVDTLMRGGQLQRRSVYQLQNVGEIGNHGWELQGSLTRGPLTVSTALTAVDSRVLAVSNAYGGDLRPGDRMLAVPARTASLTLAWAGSDWSGALTASRAASWVNYDRLRLAHDYATQEGASASLAGAGLRDYWMSYDGATRVRVSASHPLRGPLELVLTGDNLLGGQLGEPDNLTIRPGRTVTAGVRAGF